MGAPEDAKNVTFTQTTVDGMMVNVYIHIYIYIIYMYNVSLYGIHILYNKYIYNISYIYIYAYKRPGNGVKYPQHTFIYLHIGL